MAGFISRIRMQMKESPYFGEDVLLAVFFILLICSEVFHIKLETGPRPGLVAERFESNDIIQWHDENLEAAVREALKGKITAITEDDVRHIYTLDIGGRGIQDITDLSLFGGLRELDLSHNDIEDLSPVFYLDLENVDASYNNITSLNGISHMKILHGLSLTGNPLTKEAAEKLGKLRELAGLSISLPGDGSWNGDILIKCRRLYRLELTGHVEDYRFLKKLACLHHLGFYQGDMESIEPVVNAVKDMELIQLSVVGCGLENLAGIQELDKLEALDLSGNWISDVSPLEEMSGIKYLDLSNNRIDDISGLQKAEEQYRRLRLSGNTASYSQKPEDFMDKWDYDMNFSHREHDYPRARLYAMKHPDTLWGRLKHTLWNSLPEMAKNLLSGVFFFAVILSLPVMGQMRAAAMARMVEREPLPRRIGIYRVRDIRGWIGDGAGTYLRRFARLKRGKRTFNFSAAVCGPAWFAYRRMWKEALAVCAAMACVLSALLCLDFSYMITVGPYERPGWGMAALAVLFALPVGLFADGIYWAHIKKRLEQQDYGSGQRAAGRQRAVGGPGTGNPCTEKHTDQQLQEEAGTSYINGLVMLGIMMLLWRIIY